MMKPEEAMETDEKKPEVQDVKPEVTSEKKPTIMNVQSVLPNVKTTVLDTGGEEVKDEQIKPSPPAQNTTRTMVMINKDGSRVTLQVVNKSPTTTGTTTTTTNSSTTQSAVAQALAERRIVTRSKTGSLTPKQFTDSVTVTSGSLKTALAKSIEVNNSVKIQNKDGDIVHFTRSKVSDSVLSQRSVYFKLGKYTEILRNYRPPRIWRKLMLSLVSVYHSVCLWGRGWGPCIGHLPLSPLCTGSNQIVML